MIEEISKKYLVKLEDNGFYENIKNYFLKFNKNDIYQHTLEVVSEIRKLADSFKIDEEKSAIAAYLHDVGRVVDKEDLISFCQMFGERIEEDEKLFPPILHQKASKVIAENLFGINDKDILNSIGCHTTLKEKPSEIEMAVYLADKLSWQEDEYQELIIKMRTAIEHSMEEAIFYYQKNLHNKRKSLSCYHIRARESYRYFEKINDSTIT